MYKKTSSLALALVLVLIVASIASAAALFAVYFNGFETDTSGWFTDGDTISRVASGTNGVASATGDYHAEADAGAFTRWGGYSSEFPASGYSTFVDIYLDTAKSPTGADLRFDFSSAISNPDGDHRRDFIFSVGTDGNGGWVMSASNNAPGWPANPDRDTFTITQTGWYTFKHSFYDDGTSVLAVDMSVLDAAGNVLHTWTLSDPSDVIGSTVGGNRYGWFVNSAFDFLAIDNSVRSVAGDKEDCKNDGWKTLFKQDGTPFENQGQCIQYFNNGK